jgi:outer membrane receptor for ferrienterochelin and colicins
MAVLVPRASAMYLFTENLRLRASLAQGYRAPQAFNEDLHIETVGGNVLFIQLDPALEPERSNSYTASLNYIKTDGAKQWSLLAEAFHTQLRNPFILSDQEGLAEGVSIITKRNGGAAVVQGLNFEANFAFGRKAMIQSGLTFQSARYRDAEVIWSPLEEVLTPATTTRRVLRTPATYGFLTCQYQVLKSLSVSLSSVYTGPMDLAHVVGASFADDYTVLKRSRGFFEQNVKSSWDVYTKDGYRVVVYAGLQNIFNAFQDDFDEGPERDAGYVYGPMRPRTIFFGLKFGLN